MNIYNVVKKPGQSYRQFDNAFQEIIAAMDEKQCEEITTISGDKDILLIGNYTGPDTRPHIICSEYLS